RLARRPGSHRTGPPQQRAGRSPYRTWPHPRPLGGGTLCPVTTERLALAERGCLRAGAFLLPLAFWWDTYDQYVVPKLLVARALVFGLLSLRVARVVVTRQLGFKRT